MLRAPLVVRAFRHTLTFAVIGCVALLCPRPALAWIEKRVESSTTSLELAADGSAVVRHELLLEVHGAPLKSFTLRGADADAVPLPDATVIRMSGSQAEGAPQPVLLRAEAGQLDVEVPLARGLRGTSFLLRLGYRTQLAQQGLITHLPDGERSVLAWIGPRFEDGVDSVTLILRSGAGRTPPELAVDDERGPRYGMVMSTLRRTRDRDELELTRAHVARDEAMSWNVLLDRALLPGSATSADDSAPRPLPATARAPAPSSVELLDRLGLLALGVLYGLLVWLKSRSVQAAARVRRCTPRPWLPWPAAWRATLAGAALIAAGAVAIVNAPPLLGALALLSAMALSAFHAPEENPSLRGPGEWRPLEPCALDPVPSRALPGAWLDAGRFRGFILLAAALGAIASAAARAFESSPYTGACTLLGAAALLPIFCTGRAGELPFDALEHGRRFLGRVARQLAKDDALITRPIGRVAAATGEVDELRLAITPARAIPGLIGMELGIERRERLGGFCAQPVVVVRAAEGSECQHALPRGLTWMRGRSTDERASLVRPKLPTVALSVALLQELAALMLSPPSAEPAKKATRSSGKGLSTTKGSTRSSPAHAT